MNKKIVIAAMAAVALSSFAKKNNDPVLMQVNGEDIPLSEFLYLYNKNSSQQIEPVTFDQYVDMFIDYKLKVADAKAAGIDTTKEFKAEFNKFRNELAEPYLRDKAIEEALINESYSHMLEDVKVSHIMMPLNDASMAQLDSIRNEILNNDISFADAAKVYSVDKGSANKGGSMGWISGTGRLPWEFEKTAYDTPVGQISKVINSGFGYHIVMPLDRRAARGEVKAEHILLLTQGLDANAAAQKKAKIDSLYQVLNNGADFGEIAMKFSEDPGSARKGGDLGWFASGTMVQEFDSTAFAMPIGAISKPFATAYGYHIIHKSDAKGAPSLDESRPMIEKAMQRDVRSQLPLAENINKVAKQTNASLNPGISDFLRQYVQDLGGALQPEHMAALADIDFVAFTINGEPTTLGQVLMEQQLRPGLSADGVARYGQQFAQQAYDKALLDIAREQLAIDNVEYRNLSNEYRDGIMLFDMANRQVWDKAVKDKEGLEQYFQEHKDKYTWDAPKFKSYVLFAPNDSVLNKALAFAENYANANKNFTQEEFATALKDAFGKDIKLERVIAAKGENAITDYLGFSAQKPAASNPKWSHYAAFQGKIIDAPEEAADVRGAVIADYQTELEKQWVDSLHKKYPVTIDQKVLKKARAANNK